MSEDFEARLARELRSIEVPEGTDELRDRAVSRAMGFRARRRARRRTAGAAVALSLMIAGGALAVNHFQEDGRTIFGGGSDAPAARAESPYLSGLPWLWQPEGMRRVTDAPSGTVSLRFPVGFSVAEAQSELITSVITVGQLPVTAVVDRPLPRGIIADRAADGSLRLSLAAPFGYQPSSGNAKAPTLDIPASETPEQTRRLVQSLNEGPPLGEELPEGVEVSPAPLPVCQTSTAGRPDAPACPFFAP